MKLNDNIIKLKSIGEKRRELLNSKNIFTIKDIIEYYPRDYEDRSIVRNIIECRPGFTFTIKGRICSSFEVNIYKNVHVLRTKIKDDTGIINVIWFNQLFLRDILRTDCEYLFTGKINDKYGVLQIESPDYEKIELGKEFINSGIIVPIYKAIGDLSQKVIRKLVKEALDESYNELEEIFDTEFLEKYDLVQRRFAIKNIHFPENSDSFFEARRRLVFEELLILQLSLYNIKGNSKKQTDIVIKNIDLTNLFNILPYELTKAQKRVLKDIEIDLDSGLVMNRLVQGDVGSGKTVVSLILSYIIIKNGYQVALMAPTEVLAHQHYDFFCQIFDELKINTVLLSGSVTDKKRNSILPQIKHGEAKMIIGTHALIEDTVQFYNLALAITDEQHRFGVGQRGKLSEKSIISPHVLVMTATPIPRTLALILYGDLDISIIDELPPGRKIVDTYSVGSSYRQRIYAFIKKEIDKGRQAYIVCSLIEENEENIDLKSVLSYTDELKRIFKNYTVECLHGKMKNIEKQKIMTDYLEGKIDILVSTTVIEVGINVPNATIMFIENAERFGLSQLHQLRGRVGRGSEKSYCILMSNSRSKTTRERMKIMTETNDGFKISEMDLKLRGPGDYFGTRQHGLPEFKIANLYEDIDILKEAQIAANEIFLGKMKINEEFYRKLDDELNNILTDRQKILL